MVLRKEITSDRAEEVIASLLNKKNNYDPNTEHESLSTPQKSSKWKYCCYYSSAYLILGIIFTMFGILTTIYPLTQLILDERLKMSPNMPAYHLWYEPEPEILLKVYIFNVTNSHEFETGIDYKLKIHEIGPIIYKEKLKHSDVIYHTENSTMSYTVTRTVDFLPELNTLNILNQTIIVPNIPLLAMATYLQDYLFSVKWAFRLMSAQDSLFLNITIQDYLWNLTTPALKTADVYVPFMLPTNNSGPLFTIYEKFQDRVNVNIGKQHKQQDFFKINTYNYEPTVPGYNIQNGDCFASLENATEGAIYGQYLNKNDTIYYWRKTVCRPIPLYFDEEIYIRHILGYKFITKSNMFDRVHLNDCYDHFSSRNERTLPYGLPNGLSAASKCYSKVPIAMSLPHFYDRDGYWHHKIEGFQPSAEKHLSYAIIEPISGTPLDQCARAQSNLIVPILTDFNAKISKFTNMTVPLMWVEYRQEKLTPTIDVMLYILTNFLPIGQYVISLSFTLFGLFLVILKYHQLRQKSMKFQKPTLPRSRYSREL